jgi:hypothetical protein
MSELEEKVMSDIYDEENKRGKLNFISAFFNDLDIKIKFLIELADSGHRDEAFLLSCCYIDWLELGFWPNEGRYFSFVQVLRQYGGEEVFLYIHPKMLEEALSKLRGKWAELVLKKVLPILQQSRGKIYNEYDMIALLSPRLTTGEQAKIKDHLWRGTLAAIVYSRIRSPAVHEFGALDVSFDNTTFQGRPVPTINFQMLHKCLNRIANAAREKSLSTEKWFGHE